MADGLYKLCDCDEYKKKFPQDFNNSYPHCPFCGKVLIGDHFCDNPGCVLYRVIVNPVRNIIFRIEIGGEFIDVKRYRTFTKKGHFWLCESCKTAIEFSDRWGYEV